MIAVVVNCMQMQYLYPRDHSKSGHMALKIRYSFNFRSANTISCIPFNYFRYSYLNWASKTFSLTLAWAITNKFSKLLFTIKLMVNESPCYSSCLPFESENKTHPGKNNVRTNIWKILNSSESGGHWRGQNRWKYIKLFNEKKLPAIFWMIKFRTSYNSRKIILFCSYSKRISNSSELGKGGMFSQTVTSSI